MAQLAAGRTTTTRYNRTLTNVTLDPKPCEPPARQLPQTPGAIMVTGSRYSIRLAGATNWNFSPIASKRL